MKSPFTGGKVIKCIKNESFTFRNEKFEIPRSYFQCVDTGKIFSDANTDDEAINNLYSLYREKHGIPAPIELKKLRQKYGLSAHVMSKIAGIGINQYGLYENGEMPSLNIGKKLASFNDRKTLLNNIESAKEKLGKDYARVKEKVDSYSDPISIPIADTHYLNFEQILPIRHVIRLSIKDAKKARWKTCQF